MSITSKPAVTPEMVEKARLDELIRKFFPDLFSTRVGPGLAAINETGKIKLRLLMASAVQDAVREIIVLIAENRRAFRNTTCREVLVAALREKYGVSGRKGDTNGS